MAERQPVFQQFRPGASTLPVVIVLGTSVLVGAAFFAMSAQSGPRNPEQVAQARESEFRQVRRTGSVNLDEEYNLDGLTIPRDEIHTLLSRDAIPALTNPELESPADARWLPDDARVIEVRAGGEVLGVPLRILNWHEIVNITLGGEPVAATYCPLCDSASVFSRRVAVSDTSSVTLEFGVSGALYNSNVLMYDRKDRGLWSQLAMRAVSGPLAGTALDMLPVRLVPFSEFKHANPGAQIVSRDTGHNRNYLVSPYEDFFGHDGLMVPVAGFGQALPKKTPGVGLATDDQAWFVPVDAIGEELTLQTSGGPVSMTTSDAGVIVKSLPEGVRSVQTFYYSWSAFYPHTQIVRPKED